MDCSTYEGIEELINAAQENGHQFLTGADRAEFQHYCNAQTFDK